MNSQIVRDCRRLIVLAGLLLVLGMGPARLSAAGERAGSGGAAGSSGDSASKAIELFRGAWNAEPGHMRQLDDRGWKARMVALCELVKVGSPAVPALLPLLESPDAELRVFAAQALGFIGDSSAARRMDQVLASDSDAAARLYAADALGMFGGLASKPLYERVAMQDANRDVRAHVRFALERKGEAIPPEVQRLFQEFDTARMDTAGLGKAAPDFHLTDALGTQYRLSDFRGKQSVVLVFIYGDT